MTQTLRRLAPFLALLLAAPAAAQTVTGRVLPPAGGQAIASEKVQIELAPLIPDFRQAVRRLQGEPAAVLAMARPQPDGSFAIAAPEPGLYRVTVRVDGFVPLQYELGPLVEATELPPVELRPASRIEIQVLGPDGAPVPGVAVQTEPLSETDPPPFPSWQPAGKVDFTGTDGRVTALSVPGSRLGVLALATRLSFSDAEVREGPVTLRLKAVRRVDLEVRDAQGKKAAGALVRLAGFQTPLGLTGPDGRLSLPFKEALRLVAETEDGQTAVFHLSADAPSPRVVELAAPITVSGRALEAAGRSPVPGALVWGVGGMSSLRPVRAAADGSFQIRVQSSSTMIRAAAAGHQREGGRRAGPAGKGGPLAPVTLLLPRAGLLAGQVVDAGGRPVAGARVRTRQVASDNPDYEAWSGADGSFRLPRLAAGQTYELEVRKEGFAPGSAYGEATPSNKPGTPVRVVLSRGSTAFGRLVDETGKPVAGAEVEVLPVVEPNTTPADLDRLAVSGTSGADGRFEVRPLPAGLLTLQARAPGFAPASVSTIEVPAEGRGVDLGTLTLSPEAVIEGQVTDTRGAPVPGARIEIRTNSLGHEPDLFMLRRSRLPLETGADGRFRIGGLSTGTELSVSAAAEGYAEAVAIGVEAPPSAPLRLELQRLGKLAGRVVDPAGKPVSGARVVESQASRLFSPSRGSATTDDEGRFQVDVEPGSVELAVLAEGFQPGSWRGEVPERGEAGLAEITLESGAVLEGRVLAADGSPLANAEVWIVSYPEAGAPASVESGADGRYRLTGLATGVYQLAARAGLGGAEASGSIDLQPGVNRLDLTVEAGVEISGSVLDAGGSPVPGAEISLSQDGRQPYQTLSTDDGTFLLSSVQDGVFQLRAFKTGLGAAGQSLEVASRPLLGLSLRLAAGGTVTGRLLGVKPDEMGGARVQAAHGEGLFSQGVVYPNGTYQIRDLPPGDLMIRASLTSGRQATGTVTLEPGVPEAVLDLDLGGDLSLSGAVRVDGAAQRALLVLHGTGGDSGAEGHSATGQDGSFRMTGLNAGTYKLQAQLMDGNRTTMRLERTLELSAEDLVVSLEIVTGRVQGRVVSPAGTPVPQAWVSARGDYRGWTAGSFATADDQGRFELRLPAGEYRLTVNAEGLNPPETPVQVPAGDVASVQVLFQPASR